MIERSPADGVPLPAKQVTRDRVLSDPELAKVILAARQMGGPYGDIVEVLALTGQRREEVARCTWEEIDLEARTWKLSSDRTKNGKSHEVHLSGPVIAVLSRANQQGKFVFSRSGDTSFQDFSAAKRRSIGFWGSPNGDFMIFGEPAFLEWPDWVLLPTSPIRF